MKNIAFVLSQSPHIHIRVVNEKFDALDIVLEYGIVKSGVSFFTLEIYIVGISHFL